MAAAALRDQESAGSFVDTPPPMRISPALSPAGHLAGAFRFAHRQ